MIRLHKRIVLALFLLVMTAMTFSPALSQTITQTPSRVLGAEQAQAVEKALSRWGEDTRILWNTSGTPRSIQAGDGILQSAVTDGSTGETRDIATARAFLTSSQALLMVDAPDSELAVSAYQTDDLGRSHVRFQQTYQGLQVWPCEMIVHLDPDGNVDKMTGGYVATPANLSVEAQISAAEAIQAAKGAVPGTVEAASVPEPELMVYALAPASPTLAFKVIVRQGPDATWTVFVNAQTGEPIKVLTNIRNNKTTGSGEDIWGVTRSLNIWEFVPSGSFGLVDATKAMYTGDGTTNPDWKNDTTGLIVIGDFNHASDTNPELVYSLSATSGWLADGVSGSHVFSQIYDYYYNRFSRNSFDNNGKTIYGLVRFQSDYSNAFYSDEEKAFFFGDGKNYIGALDVVAHEFTHGVTAHSANLVYLSQSGAMNEAFSDIFGESCENHVQGSNDWLIGSQIETEGMRNLKNPGALEWNSGKPYPAKLSEYYTLGESESEDYGGVHINCTIIAHAYYQLAAGLSGAIGIQAAEQIFYRALTYFLTSSSQFTDCRIACIAAAREIYGTDSNEAAQTDLAFDAVGITSDSSGSSSISLSSPFSYKLENNTVTIGVGRIANAGTATSNNLTLWLKASTTPYSGGTFSGYDLGSAGLGTLDAGASWSDVEKAGVYTAPPQGTYYVTFAVTENINGQEVIVAFYTMDSTSELGPTSYTSSSDGGGGGGCFIDSARTR